MATPSSTYGEKGLDQIKGGPGKLTIQSKLTNKTLTFPAFITSFSQTFTSNWNEESVYGRMDPIATFQNTTRAISLSFDLPASSLSAAKSNLDDCDELAKFLYPGMVNVIDKGSNTRAARVIARPPLVAVKYANLVSSGNAAQLGWMNGLTWTPMMEMGMFVDGDKLYPKVISLSFVLNVLHQADKGFVKGKEGGDQWISDGFFGQTKGETK